MRILLWIPCLLNELKGVQEKVFLVATGRQRVDKVENTQGTHW